MIALVFSIPFADFKTVEALARSKQGFDADTVIAVLGLCLLLGFAYLVLRLWIWALAPPKPLPEPLNWILVDGSNVMHWQDNTPKLAPLLQVVAELQALGYAPGVVFDANVGYKLFGKYLHDDDLARILYLPREQVLVVPKGTQADPFLLATARDFEARVVTNDRYRDWAETYPEVRDAGFLIRGGMRDGRVWLADAVRVQSAGELGRSRRPA